MENAPEKRRGKFGRIVAASIAVHLVVAALIFVRLPDQQTPEKEDAVNVDLVPPPEEKKPEQQMAQKVPEPKPEKKAEKAPEPPPPPPPAPTPEKQEGQQAPQQQPPQEKAEEKKPAPPPPPPKPEEKPPEKAPVPPKQKPPEAPKPPEKPPEPPKPPEPQKEEAKAEEPPKADSEETEKPSPHTGPTHQFGDKDSGPRKSLNGESAEQTDSPQDSSSPDHADDLAKAEPPKSDAVAKPAEKTAAASPVAKDINLPKIDATDLHSEKDAPASAGTDDLNVGVATEKNAVSPVEKTEQKQSSTKARPTSEPKLKKAKSLYSTIDSSDPMAMTAMAGIPRETRFIVLCKTELAAQLSRENPSYQTGLVAMPPHPKGTVIDVGSDGAFSDPYGWYDVSFKCEVNEDVTKVVSFAYAVGNAIPRSEWRRRHLPEPGE